MVLEHKVKVCDLIEISNNFGPPCVKLPRKTIRKRSCVEAFGQSRTRPEVRRDVYFDSKGPGVVLRNRVNKLGVCLCVQLRKQITYLPKKNTTSNTRRTPVEER